MTKYLILILLSLTSCASLKNKKYGDIYIDGNFDGGMIIELNNTKIFSGYVLEDGRTGLASILRKVEFYRRKNIVKVTYSSKNETVNLVDTFSRHKYLYISYILGELKIESSEKMRLYY
ncbi:MAG: hypothetical protein H6605_00185 [Flavobacteriales bacterium]|nr:hypothetical protein [Flavobacteriales bacterium]